MSSAPARARAPIVIAAGGTGGHVFPAEALRAELVRRGRRVVMMTDARSAAANPGLFPEADRDRGHFVLRGAGVAGRGWRRGAAGLAGMAAGLWQARRILARLAPASVVGFGGYPTVAPVLAAGLLRTRPAIVLHEQNAVLGRANRRLARRADLLALGFDETLAIPPGVATAVTGNPVRDPILAIAPGYEPPDPHGEGDINLLVTGGSLGARVFGTVLPEAVFALPTRLRMRLRIAQQVRAEDLERVRAFYARGRVQADLSPFFPDIAARLADAHLVVARAGASTVAELLAAGRPSLLVPLPGAIDDHQARNAEAAAGATVMMQPDFTGPALCERLQSLLGNRDGLARAAAAARAAARPGAAARLADLVEEPLGLGVTSGGVTPG